MTGRQKKAVFNRLKSKLKTAFLLFLFNPAGRYAVSNLLSDIQQITVCFQRSVCLMGKDFLGQNLTQLHAFLIEAVYIPYKALEHDLVLKV